MRQIQHLYRVESRLREQKAGPRLRAAVRAHESKPIVKRLERAFIRLKSSGRYLPQSLLGIAMDYALGQWQTLDVYLEDGRVETRQQPGRKRHPAHGHWQKELALYGRCRCGRTWGGYQSVRPVLSRCADSVRIFADVSADSRLVDPLKCLMQAHQDLEARVGIGLSHRFRCQCNRINPCNFKENAPLLATIVHYFLLQSLTVSLKVGD